MISYGLDGAPVYLSRSIRAYGPIMSAAGNGLLNNLIAYWPGNELAGNALDLHTNALHLNDVNTVTSNPGLVYPLARQYTAANYEYHTRANEALLQSGNVDFTVTAWVNATSFPALPGIVGKDGVSKREFSLLYVSASNRLFFQVYDGTSTQVAGVYANTFGALPTGVWTFVVASYNAVLGRAEISVNNGAVDTSAAVGVPGVNTSALTIGRYYDDGAHLRYWNGRIAPTAFWKSAAGGGGVLSSSQRSALYNAGAGLPYASFTT